jgi:hypothetical protein
VFCAPIIVFSARVPMSGSLNRIVTLYIKDFMRMRTSSSYLSCTKKAWMELEPELRIGLHLSPELAKFSCE